MCCIFYCEVCAYIYIYISKCNSPRILDGSDMDHLDGFRGGGRSFTASDLGADIPMWHSTRQAEVKTLDGS